jgi:hypothetical protein
MKINLRNLTSIFLVPVGMIIINPSGIDPTTASAAETGDLNLENRVTVEGTATLYGEWSCSGPAEVQAIPGKALAPVPGFPNGIVRAVVEVPVAELECGDGSMNEHLRKALKEKDFPKILFQMDRYDISGDGYNAMAFGKFSLSGETKPIKLHVALRSVSNEGIYASGKFPVKMKEYGVKPPSRLFGALKVSNEVTVSFNSFIQPPHEKQEGISTRSWVFPPFLIH